MREALLAYFAGEKHAGLLLAGVGLTILAIALLLYQERWGLFALAVTLAIIAIVEIVIGVGLYIRTGPQVTALVAKLDAAETSFVATEMARMARVQRNFVIIQVIEVAVIVGAALAVLAFKERWTLANVALGLLCHAAFLLAFDMTAERRAAIYLSALRAELRMYEIAAPSHPAEGAARR